MSLVALDGTPLCLIGINPLIGNGELPSTGTVLMDAANEACIYLGQVFTEDGASHTIDTSGSSSLGWRAGSVTFANGGTTVKVGLAALDNTTGPPGRAANASDVITFDVSKSLTGGGGGISSLAWQTHVPDTGTKTLANGDFCAFCVQMTARGGADSVAVSTAGTATSALLPGTTSFTGGSYTNASGAPNCVITFSDGALGFFYGGSVATVQSSTTTWNSGSATKEYGNYFKAPFPMKIYGAVSAMSVFGNLDVVLYSSPLSGSPVAERTTSFDLNTVQTTNTRWTTVLFASPYSTTVNQELGIIIKPTSGTNVQAVYKTFDSSSHQKSESFGTNGYAVNRASGAFAAQNSNKDRYGIGLLVGAFDAGGVAGRSMPINNMSVIA